MAETVGDHVLQRLREWGVEQVFAYPGDGINGIVAAFGKADDSPAFIQARHEEMSRVAGRRLRQVLRQGRRLHGHLRPGRDPPAERSLRRQTRPRAGRRDRRADRAQRDGRLLPAGGRPAGAVQGRGERVPRRGQRPRAAAAGDRPRDPHRADPSGARPRSSSRATCRPSRTARRSTSSSRSRPARRRCTPRRSRPTPPNSPAPQRSSMPGSGSRSWSARARAVRPTRSHRWPTSSARASRRRCSARTC